MGQAAAADGGEAGRCRNATTAGEAASRLPPRSPAAVPDPVSMLAKCSSASIPPFAARLVAGIGRAVRDILRFGAKHVGPGLLMPWPRRDEEPLPEAQALVIDRARVNWLAVAPEELRELQEDDVGATDSRYRVTWVVVKVVAAFRSSGSSGPSCRHPLGMCGHRSSACFSRSSSSSASARTSV